MKVLTIKSYSELQALVSGEITTVEAKMVEKEFADKPENNVQKIIPYAVFYHIDPASAKLDFIQYLRTTPQVAEGEEAPAQVSSIGFGLPVSEQSVIISTEHVVEEDSTVTRNMSVQDLMDTALSTVKDAVKTQTGLDIDSVLGNVIDFSQLAFFKSDAPGDANLTEIGVAVPVKLTAEQFEIVRTVTTLNSEYITKLDRLGIRIDRIVEEMDLTPTLTNVLNELVSKFNIEPWSAMMFNYIVRKELHDFLVDVSYQDIIALVNGKAAARAEAAVTAAAQQAQATQTETAEDQPVGEAEKPTDAAQ